MKVEHQSTGHAWKQSSTYWTLEESIGDLLHIWINADASGVTLTIQDDTEGKCERKLSWQDVIDIAQEDKLRDAWIEDKNEYPAEVENADMEAHFDKKNGGEL